MKIAEQPLGAGTEFSIKLDRIELDYLARLLSMASTIRAFPYEHDMTQEDYNDTVGFGAALRYHIKTVCRDG